jgi:hypothetical protein
MIMPIVMDVMACAGVRPIPIRLLPMVHDERQMPHVPAKALLVELEVFGTRILTPIAYIRVDAVRSLVVRNGVHISVTPATRLNCLILIVCRLDFESPK